MSAVSIVRELLVNASSVTALVPIDRIISGVVPQGTALPCLALTEVVTVEVPTIDANSPTVLVDGRVQITILAQKYTVQKQLLTLVRKACNYERGTIAGYDVVSVRRLANGPDFGNREAGIHMQTIDFSVVYDEPN